jgi:hypothetical protein
MIRREGGLEDDGFLQRFQPFFSETLSIGQDREPNHAATARYEKAIRALIALPVPKPNAIIRLSADARRYWNDIELLSFKVSQGVEYLPHLRSHAAKWAGMFARLMLAFHAVECADKAGAGLERLEREVSGDTACKAHRLFAEFLKPHAMQFYDRLFRPAHDTERHARWVAGYILAHEEKKITARTIKRAYRQLPDDGAVSRIMDALREIGWVGEVQDGGGNNGRASFTWPVNPKVHVLFGDRAKTERTRREEARALIKRKAEAGREHVAERSTGSVMATDGAFGRDESD